MLNKWQLGVSIGALMVVALATGARARRERDRGQRAQGDADVPFAYHCVSSS